jgi:hypothetical protein
VISFDLRTAASFAAIALANVSREYPNKLDHVISDAAAVLPPRALHPAFYGSFDWHSSVHMHWLLARCRRLHPSLPGRAAIDGVCDRHFAPKTIAVEVAYLSEPHARAFERTYGWAWLLKLADELHQSDDAAAWRWSRSLTPLADAIVARYFDYLPRAQYPLRYGAHANSAFGLALALDYAKRTALTRLIELCEHKAREWFLGDREVPATWEPSGADFLSPALMEADLMRRVLARDAYASWLAGFLPGFSAASPQALFAPVEVGDRSDGQIVHLDGLNFSRAWNLAGIASSLPGSDSRVEVARAAASRHVEAGMSGLESGDYVGEHWLASFATLALTETPDA